MGKVETEFMKRKKNQLPLVGGIITKLASDPMVLGMAQGEIASRAGRYIKGKRKSNPDEPEYQVTLDESGRPNWQHRDFDGSVYKREYPSLLGLINDLRDKFGGRFANKVEKQLKSKGVSTNRKNPNSKLDTSRADAIAKGWHGREPKGSIEIEESESYEQTGVVLGDLMELGILSPAGGQGTFDNKKIVFKHNKPLLVGDLDRENLDIVGGDQEIQGLPCSKQYLPIGFVVSIVYETDKHHLEGSTGSKDPYEHYFGEEFYRDNGYEWNDGESGEDFLIKVTESELLFEAIERELLPLLVYDTVNTRMKLIGGQYTIEDVGITN